MRSIIILLLALVGFVAGYFLYPTVKEKFGLEGRRSKGQVTQQVIQDPSLLPPPPPPPTVKPEPENKPEPMPEPAPPMPEKPVVTLPPKPDPDVFRPANYPPVEVFTVNWTKISPTAFPRQVSIKKEVVFKMTVGTSQMAAGSQVFALGMDTGNLVLAPTRESSARATVPLEDTNLKQELTTAYNSWVERRIARDKSSFEFKKTIASQAAQFGSTSMEAKSNEAGGGAPVADAQGRYPILVESMKAQQVTEVTPENVKTWSKPEFAEIDGQKYWTVIVSYDAVTPFGTFETEAQALIRNNVVEKWIYTGSKEEVP
jgi:hypothetical protein